MLWLSVKDRMLPRSVKASMTNRPVIGSCDLCGSQLRGKTREMSGDKIYRIDEITLCFECAHDVFDQMYLCEDIL